MFDAGPWSEIQQKNMFDAGPWSEIERISGVPFRRSSQSHSTSNERLSADIADLGTYAAPSPSATTPSFLIRDFKLANISSIDAVMIRLQRELVYAQNHAAVTDIESNNVREQNRQLEETNTNLAEQLSSLNDNLHARVEELHKKQSELNSAADKFDVLTKKTKQTEDELLARVNALENELANQKKEEEKLRNEQALTLHELQNAHATVKVLDEKVQHLQVNLSDSIQQCKQNEKKALAAAQAEAKHNVSVLEAKLSSMNDQLLKAEEREQRACARVEEAIHEAACSQKSMYETIAKERKELMASHAVEVEKIKDELESANHKLVCMSNEVQEANLRLTKHSEKSTKSLHDAENRVMEMKHELESQCALCAKLQGEIDEVREVITGHYSFLYYR